ncbi:tetratricopeptide repeat protein [Rhizobacter sp. SG703]|uniref:tetratricopeptide repeat protein n=1 Tax=Rhizobacter sp. SG703 TaxID=2587140 RepID=UPI001444F1CA|nr:tetratricopeptide repeat protein [Rhizobacter sp. SG703]NKI94064.1 Flp pilus assembly protein TadD [Rhizobacter sp. SG703]
MRASTTPPAPESSSGVLAKDDMRLLADIGFLAAMAADPARADAIFSGLRVLAPTSACPYVGIAMTRIAMRRADEAVRLLRDEALAKVPDDDHDIRLFLGMSLLVAGKHDEARRVLERVVADAPQGANARITAQEVLQSAAMQGRAPGGPASLRPAAAPPFAGSARTPG